jgi:hypothetical protein
VTPPWLILYNAGDDKKRERTAAVDID